MLPQDPSVRDSSTGKILRAVVPVPQDTFLPGPKSSRFQVIDYDGAENRLYPPTTLRVAKDADDDSFDGLTDAKLPNDADFRNQNVYAIASRTLAAFENALGRRVPWSFSGHQLYLVPRAFREANAYYDPNANGILFGAFDGFIGPPTNRRRGTVYTALSGDIVAHETTHAVLDGLRARYLEPGLPDQLAFHEAFADVVALLSAFSIPALVSHALGGVDARGRIPKANVDTKILQKGVLTGFAEEMGAASKAHSGDALRRSVERLPNTAWRTDPTFDEPHRRGEILVGAVMQAFLGIWSKRMEELISEAGTLSRARAAEEGAKSAEHVLRMVIRAIDYCPPLEFEFEDFVEALLVSDAEAAPTDAHDYRTTLREAFKGFGIEPQGRVRDLAQLGTLDYRGLNATELRNREDELFRFLWQNATALGLEADYYASVDDLWPSIRVSPEGFFLQETVATYRQMVNGTVAELRALSKRLSGKEMDVPDGLPDGTKLQIHGGASIVFDQFGRSKHQLSKPIFDWKRQAERLKFLVRNRLTDSAGNYGASLGLPRGQEFAVLHDPDAVLAERW